MSKWKRTLRDKKKINKTNQKLIKIAETLVFIIVTKVGPR